MQTVKLRELRQQLCQILPNATHEVDWLLSHYLEIRKSELPLHMDEEISPEQQQLLLPAAEQRAAGKPLQYVTGLQPFWDFELIVSPAVLIPRWDSEPVIEQAISLIPKAGKFWVADICTGSGAYALAIKHSRPNVTITATDISSEALTIAAQNVAKYQLEIELRQGDLVTALPQDCEFDLIVSNPPYIKDDEPLPDDVRQEPALALFGGADGLDFYRRLARETLPHLRAGGHILLEIGCEQAAAVQRLLQEQGFVDCCCGQDYAGLDRWVQARKPE